MNKTLQLNKIKDDLINFKASPLYPYRRENKYFPVFGEGNPDADIVFIGEAPGKKEAMSGKPFCGTSGKILDELLNSVGLDRKDIYITNIVKDRPPENRDPTLEEIEMYGPFLDKQLEIIKPKVIATLGRFSMIYMMQKTGLEEQIVTISEAHGKVYVGKLSLGKVAILPLYHPAASIYNQKLKLTLKDDFKIMEKYVSR